MKFLKKKPNGVFLCPSLTGELVFARAEVAQNDT